MSTTIVEQRLPAYVQLLSRVPVYAHFFQSIVAIFVLWAFPSLRPKMPARRVVYKLRAWSSHSLKSSTSTLVEFSSEDYAESTCESEGMRKELLVGPIIKTTSPSFPLAPYASRTSPSTKRLSEHSVCLVPSDVAPVTLPSASNTSPIPPLITFSKVKLRSGSRLWRPSVDDHVIDELAGQFAESSETSIPTSLQRTTKYKRVAQKAKGFLLTLRRSQGMQETGVSTKLYTPIRSISCSRTLPTERGSHP